MKIIYKNLVIAPLDIWFLDSIKDFDNRKLLIGKLKNGAAVVSLIEKRKADGKLFIDTQVGIKADKIIQNEKLRVQYTRQDILCSRKGKPYRWTYGENKEIHNAKGEIVCIRQKRCDYFGQKETVNETPL